MLWNVVAGLETFLSKTSGHAIIVTLGWLFVRQTGSTPTPISTATWCCRAVGPMSRIGTTKMHVKHHQKWVLLFPMAIPYRW